MKNKNIRVLTLAGLFNLLLPLSVSAEDQSWYLGLGINGYDIQLNEESFFPRQVKLHAGHWIRPGIGLEIHAGGGAGSYNSEGLEIGVDNYVGALVRWQSTSSRIARAYILTGYGQLELDGEVDNTGFPGNETFDGPVLGIGLMFAWNKTTPWSAGLGYSHYFLEDDMTTESIDATIQYEF